MTGEIVGLDFDPILLVKIRVNDTSLEMLRQRAIDIGLMFMESGMAKERETERGA